MTAPTLDFTNADQRDGEWFDPDSQRYRFLDRSTGTGWHRWEYDPSPRGEYGDPIGWGWHWHGVMAFNGPFIRVPLTDELGEYADWDEGWGIEA